MQTVSVRWCLGISLNCEAQSPEFESLVVLDNFPGMQMCKQCNMILKNNLVVHNK